MGGNVSHLLSWDPREQVSGAKDTVSGMGGSLGGLFGAPAATGQLSHLANSGYTNQGTQMFLPYGLRYKATDPYINAGIAGIGNLIEHPGGLSPDVAAAIAPRLSAESQNIAAQYRGIGQNQAGAAARGNLPVSIKTALQSALDIAQERAQRGARGEALSQSEELRRSDLGQTYGLLNAINSFIQSGKGQAIQGLAGAQQGQAQGQASTLQTIGTLAALAAVFMSGERYKEDIVEASDEAILDAIARLPVYEWSYKGDDSRHVGPLAEDFMAAFGLGDASDRIHVVDAVGTLMAATKALTRKVERLEGSVV